MPEPGGELLTNAVAGIVGSHDVILHSLDTWRPYQKSDGSYETRFYGSDLFEGTEKEWESVPVILGDLHPGTPYTKNQNAALEQSKGRIIGNLTDVVITRDGTSLLKSKLHLFDPEAESLLKSGKLALSTGFISGISDGRLTGVSGKVIPDHVLAFEHSRTNRPQDGAALILNNSGVKMTEDVIVTKSVLSEFLAELKAILVPPKADPLKMPDVPVQTMVPNMTETKIAELEKVNAEQAELIKNMTVELEGFKKAEEERAKQEIENTWNLVKNSISPGLTATPEQEAIARKEWETNKDAFYIKNATTKAPETQKEGVEFVKNASGNPQSESDAEYLKFINGDE